MRVINVTSNRNAKQALRFEVRLKRFNLRLGAARALEVVQRFVIDRKETHRCTVFGSHVGDGGAVWQAQSARAFAVELNKLTHHFVGAQDLGHRQHQVGRGHALAQAARHLKADDIRCQKVNGLAEHRGLGLNATAAPGDYADAVDHRGVTVCADQGVGVVNIVSSFVYAARQVLQVHLMHNAEARRHHAKCVKRLHAPLHELVALAVALEFELHVQVQRVLFAVVINHHRMINHQINRHQRLDAFGVLAELHRHAAHRRQVRQQRHASEVLQHHA